MPYKKQTTKRPRRRYNRKRNFVRKTAYKYVPSGLPATRIAKLVYNDTITLTSSSGLMATYRFRTNSIYDPDYTGIGH